jgi:hypothetical protein
MRKRVVIVSIISAFAVQSAEATCPVPLQNTPNVAARKLAVAKLSDQMNCDPNDITNDKSPCNTFASRGLQSLYGVNDFVSGNGALSANAIADSVAQSPDWVNVGNVFNEDNNFCAQALANDAYPVIAVISEPGHGHIALVIPGELKRSPLWGFNVANGASFRLDAPGKAFVGDLISLAFSVEHAKKAQFYYRKASVPGVSR